jgi:tetratricopeptide (TPR) repeat protein
MRQINYRFLFLLFASLGILAGGTVLLHAFQVKRHAGAFLDQASRAEEQKRPERAADYIARYLAFVPGDTATRFRYGLLLKKLAQSPREQLNAFLVLERALQQQPDRHDVRREVVQLALEIERFAEARESLEKLLKETPRDVELRRQLAHCEEASGHYADAAKAYQAAIDLDRHHLDTYAAFARLRRRQLSEKDGADKLIEEMLAQNPDSAPAYLAAARYHQEFGERDPAAERVAKAYALAPDDTDVLVAMADVAENKPDRKAGHKEAEGYLHHALDLHPKETRLHLAMAQLLLRSGERTEAIDWLHKVLDLHPEDPAVLWAVTDLLLDADELKQAQEVLARLRKTAVAPALADYQDARVLYAQGAWWQAGQRFADVRLKVERSPELLKRVNLFLGKCSERLGNPDLAISSYRSAATIDPLWPPARLGLASASLTLGKIDAALEEYRTIQQIPESRLAIARLLILRNLRAPTPERSWREVEFALKQSEQLLPNLVDVPILWAECYAGQDRLADAKKVLDGVPDKLRQEPAYWVARAGLAERMKQREQVLPLLEEAERRLGKSPELHLARARYWAKQRGAAANAALAKLEQEVAGYPAADQPRLRYGLAEAHYRLGDLKQAERLWTQVAEAEGQQNSLYVRFLLFDLALQQGDDAGMRRLSGQIHTIEGDGGVLWRYAEAARLLRLAESGDKHGLGEARGHLAEVVKKRPAWSRGPLLEARIAELGGDSEEIIKNYQAAVRQGERQPQVIRRLVQLLYERQRYVEADEVIRKLPEQAPISGDLAKLAAEMSLRNQDAERALELAQLAVSADSRSYQDHVWLGQILWALGRNDEAEKHFREAITLADDAPDPWVALVQFLARTKQQDRAEEVLREARAKVAPERQVLALAQCCEALGRGQEAEKQYVAALKERPDDANLLRGVAHFYLRNGLPHQAEPHLHHLLDSRVKASADDLAWGRRTLAFALATTGTGTALDQAMVLLEQNRKGKSETIEDQRTRAVVLALQPGKQAEAVVMLEDLGKRQPLTPDEQFLLAKLYEAAGDWRKARGRLLSLVTAHDDNPLFLSHYVHGLVVRGDTDEAGFWLAKLEKVESDPARLADLRSEVLRKQGKLDEALAAVQTYQRMEKADPRLVAGLLERLGDRAAGEAEAAYRRLVDELKKPDDLLLFAGFLGRRGRVDQALDLCARAGETGPPEAVAGASVAVLRAGDANPRQTARVEAWLTATLDKKPTVGLQLDLANLRDYQHRYGDAMTVYRQVLAQDPGNVLALNNLAWLLALDARKPDEALELLRRAFEHGGATAGLLDTRAVILLERRQADLALKDLERAITLAPSASGYFHLAQAQQLARNREAAAAALRRARALGLQQRDLHPLQHPAYQQLQSLLEKE